MIKWPITFETYDGEKVTENFYFNLSKAELAQMQFNADGSFSNYIERIMNERDYKSLGEEFRKLILMSYGKKSDDGRVFRKSEELRNDFENSPAYSELYIQLLGDSEAVAKFITGILPKDMQAEATKEADKLLKSV